MFKQVVTHTFSASLLALLVACGGGGSLGDGSSSSSSGASSSGSSSSGSSSGTSTSSSGSAIGPAAVTLLTSAPQLPSNADEAAESVTLTAIVKDANNNVLTGQVVSFAANSGALTIVNGTTDENGRASARLSTGGDPQNRSITVRATSGTVTDTTVVPVIGTTLTIVGPANTQQSAPTTYTLTLTDSGGVGIANRPVQVSTQAGNAISSNMLTTDSLGQARVTLTATVATSSITAVALGLTTVKNVAVSSDDFVFISPADGAISDLGSGPLTLSVRWRQNGTPVPNGTVVRFSTTRGTLSAPSAATTDGVASVTITGTDAGNATVTASSDQLSRPSTSIGIIFRATQANSLAVQADPAVISVGQTSTITAIVRDASSNLVRDKSVEFRLTDTTGGTLSSSVATTNSQGVAQVTYTASSTASATDGVRIDATARNADGSSRTNLVRLTVGGRALRITLGTGNEIFEPNETTYQLPYSALVTDSAGNPVSNARFQLNIVSVGFVKGDDTDEDDDGQADVALTGCPTEDVDFDGILDAGEDTDGDGVLDPGNVASVPTTATLGADGTVQFNVTYPQDRGRWVFVQLTARASVDGTEATERATFLLQITEPDSENPPGGSTSPYGVVADCSSPF